MSDQRTDVRRGSIVVVELDPTRGHEMQKTRPGVVVQNDTGNRNASTTVVAPATTTHRGYPFEIHVRADGSDFERDSSIRVDQLRTIDIAERVRSVVGHLSASVMREVDDALRVELALD